MVQRFGTTALTVCMLWGAAAAAPGDGLVGEWQGPGGAILTVTSVNGEVTVDGAYVDCVDEVNCREDNFHHEGTRYYIKGGKLLAQYLPGDTGNPEGKPTVYKRRPPGIPPGRYRLTLSVDINTLKAPGEKWDPAGDPPDPVITATVRGSGKPLILKCTQNDTFIANCLTGNEIDVDLLTTIEVALTDNDAFSNDNIAKVGPFKFATAANRPGQPLPTPASGKVSSVLLQLDPVASTAAKSIMKLKELEAAMCVCLDPACTAQVLDRMTAWSAEFGGAGTQGAQPTEQEQKELTKISIHMSACIAQSAAPPSAPAIPAECLAYEAGIKRFETCTKVPLATRDAMRSSFDQMSASWASWASMPAEARAAMATGCKSAADALKQASAACN